jgi:hypothetical protein
MGTNACARPLNLSAEVSRPILPRLGIALANSTRAIASLRYRLFSKTRESEQGIVAQDCPVHATERVDDRAFIRSSEKETPGCAEFIQTQSQLMETMLHSMILASGGTVDGSASRNGSKPKH